MAEHQDQSRMREILQIRKKELICMKGIRGQKGLVLFLVMAGIFCFFIGVSRASPDAQLDLKTTAEKEIKVQKNGKWVIEKEPLEKTNPRDVIVYTVTYTNVGKNPVVDATIVDPIPAGTSYILDSAKGENAKVTCSIDGGRSFLPPPIWIKFKKPDGTVEKRQAPADRYTHVRWIIRKPVLPGRSGRVSLKVTVK